MMQVQQFSATIKSICYKFLYHTKNSIKIILQQQESFQRIQGTYQYEQLPLEFRLIFETLKQLYTFLTVQTKNRIRYQGNCVMNVIICINGKMKTLSLPLQKVVMTSEQSLKKVVQIYKTKIQAKDSQIISLKVELQKLKNILQDRNNEKQQNQRLIAEKQCENLKLNNKIRMLQVTLQEIHSQKQKSQKSHNATATKSSTNEKSVNNESSPTQENPLLLTLTMTPVKKVNRENPSKYKKQKQLQQYGKKWIFKPDEACKHKNKFLLNGNEIQKLHGPTYQLFHNEPLPKEGRFYFDLKIIFIKNNNIVIGIITDKNKEQQFSFKKLNCVCYNGYDGSICQQDRQRYCNIKPKEGNKIRTVIDMGLGQIQWYMIGGTSDLNMNSVNSSTNNLNNSIVPSVSSKVNRIYIGKAIIPSNMLKQNLFPYFELYWQGNKIRLNP